MSVECPIGKSSYNGYCVHGCRCEACTTAAREYKREYALRRQARRQANGGVIGPSKAEIAQAKCEQFRAEILAAHEQGFVPFAIAKKLGAGGPTYSLVKGFLLREGLEPHKAKPGGDPEWVLERRAKALDSACTTRCMCGWRSTGVTLRETREEFRRHAITHHREVELAARPAPAMIRPAEACAV